jgi:hypothetical protein
VRVSSFGDLAPEPAPAPPPRPVWLKPEATLGGVVPEELLLARTDEVAVAVGGITAYPTGFEFTLTAVLRRDDPDLDLLGPAFANRFSRDDRLPDGFLRLGVEFSDGTLATNVGYHFAWDEPADALLTPTGGGGSGRRYDMRYWLWPLPPSGPLTFVCDWQVVGVRSARRQIDAQLLVDAATRAVPLWPGADRR